MKQNGYRFVQRKFAQGVPTPQYINVAPPGPERKPEPPRDDRPVYHSGMSARSLLDIVALQGVHKHKQPMVLLERLREDEMPPASPALQPKRKIRLNAKRKNEPCVCSNGPVCDSRKRASGEIAKVPAKKCARLESQSSAAEDDMPLLYLSSGTQQTPPPKASEAAFKRPASSRVIATRKPWRNKLPVPRKGRVVLRASSKGNVRRSNRRLVRLRTDAPRKEERVLKKTALEVKTAVRRLPRRTRQAAAIVERSVSPAPRRLRPVSGRRSGESSAEDSRSSRRFSSRSEDATNAESNKSLSQLQMELRRTRKKVVRKVAKRKPPGETGATSVSGTASKEVQKSPTNPAVIAGASKNTKTSIATKTAGAHSTANKNDPPATPGNTQNTLQNGVRRSNQEHPASPAAAPVPSQAKPLAADAEAESKAKTRREPSNSKPPLRDNTAPTGRRSECKPATLTAPEHMVSLPTESVDLERTNTDDPPTETRAKGDEAEPRVEIRDEIIDILTKPAPKGWCRPRACPSSYFNSVQSVIEALNKRVAALSNRCRACHGCTIVDKIEQLSKLTPKLHTDDVYDFTPGAEDVCLSLPSLRDQSRLARTDQKESYLYLDLLAENSPHIVQVISRRNQHHQIISKANIIYREHAKNIANQSLIGHEKLLDVLLECVSADRTKMKETETIVLDDDDSPPAVPARPEPVIKTEAPARPSPGTSTAKPAAAPRPARLQSLSSGSVDEPRGSKRILQAPVFRPTVDEFQDPIKYYMKIAPEAAKYGLCKIVPPTTVSPPCDLNDAMRFVVIYQYISKLYNRWGPVARELAAIKAYLATQSVIFSRLPLLDGNEINLAKLYHSVLRHGGPTKVLQHKRWGKVAEDMKLQKLQNPKRKLDNIFMRYLLPYATLSHQERQDLHSRVERGWANKYQKMLQRARNPYHRQQRLLGELSSSDDEGDDDNTAGALNEAEDCIVKGRTMNLATFKKLAASAMEAHLDPSSPPSTEEVEKAYWRVVLVGTEHIVANTASIDTGEEGYGFPKDPQAPYGSHPWNLKNLLKNPKNVLRFLGPVLGVTVPTLHLGMLFSTSCWHRDPHGLPWAEYMHSGPEKIWYGIPSSQSENFRRAVSILGPAYCQNKPIWLASDIAMIPPYMLAEHDVTLSRITQQPGEYVLVFPEAYSCSVCTGLSVTESVYFAAECWLDTVVAQFQELRNSCEPTMFSLEQLLMNAGRDLSVPRHVLLPTLSVLGTSISTELEHRRALRERGLQLTHCPNASPPHRTWNSRYQDECEYCRCSLYVSKVLGITGRKSAVCPEDAIRLLDSDKYSSLDLSTLRFQSQFTSGELETILTDLETRCCDEKPANIDY